VLVTEQDADLRRHLTLLRRLSDHLLHLPDENQQHTHQPTESAIPSQQQRKQTTPEWNGVEGERRPSRRRRRS
jgi:hypothetical protein